MKYKGEYVGTITRHDTVIPIDDERFIIHTQF